MRRLFAFIIVLVLGFGLGTLTACSDLDRYRYPCQDPSNIDTVDCRPPACDMTGTCTSDLTIKENTP